MKKLIVIASIFILCGFNGLLLYTVSSLQDRIKTSKQQILRSEHHKLQTLHLRISNSSIKLPDSGLALSIFFSEEGCRFCVEHEIQNLNKFYDLYTKYVHVYLLGYNKSYLHRLFGATFPYVVITPGKPIFNTKFILTNPVAVLTDSIGMVHQMYLTEKGKQQKSDQFYHRMRLLFSSLRKE